MTQTPTTFEAMRKQANHVAEIAKYARGEEVGHPCLSRNRTIVESAWTCPSCHETVKRNDSGGTAFEACQCIHQAFIQAKFAELDRLSPGVCVHEWEHTGVDTRFKNARFDNFSRRPGAEQALDICKAYAEEWDPQKGLLLYGPPGSGKTHLAVATMWAIMNEWRIRPLFVEAVQLLRETKRFRDAGGDPVERCIEADLLVLDDVGNHYTTPYAQEQLYAIVSARYNACAATIVTTNLNGKGLADTLGSTLRSRLNEMCQGVKFTAKDFRMPESEEGQR